MRWPRNCPKLDGYDVVLDTGSVVNRADSRPATDVTADWLLTLFARLTGQSDDPRGPFLVHVAPDNGSDALIELVYGRADRAMLTYTYTDTDFGGTTADPELPPAGELHYDYGTVDPDRSRLTRTRAGRAVAEFIATGTRPSGLSWQE